MQNGWQQPPNRSDIHGHIATARELRRGQPHEARGRDDGDGDIHALRRAGDKARRKNQRGAWEKEFHARENRAGAWPESKPKFASAGWPLSDSRHGTKTSPFIVAMCDWPVQKRSAPDCPGGKLMKTCDPKTMMTEARQKVLKLKAELGVAERKAATAKLAARTAKADYKRARKATKASRKVAKEARRAVTALQEALATAERQAIKVAKKTRRGADAATAVPPSAAKKKTRPASRNARIGMARPVLRQDPASEGSAQPAPGAGGPGFSGADSPDARNTGNA